MRQSRFAPSEYHERLVASTPREFAWRGQDFAPWQRALRARLKDLLGAWPAERCPLDVEELEREETAEFVRTKLVFRAEEGADVPAHLLVPKGLAQPLPAMICLQGHSPGMHISIGEAHNDRERESIAGGRDFAVQAVREGFVALALEQRCFGERAETRLTNRWDHSCLDAVAHSLMLGKTVLGERVWDVMRGIDVLQGRPEVDGKRIACMGNSGGGTVTFYAACLDERIALGVSSCCFCNFAVGAMRVKHCGCFYVPGVLRVAEMGELGGLVAPRRLLIVAGEHDPLSPIDGVRDGFKTARSIFEAAGCAENVRLTIGPEGHRFYADRAWPLIGNMMP